MKLMRLRTIFRRNAIDREMIEEMRLHIERATERLIARGLSPDEARRAARREFGGAARHSPRGDRLVTHAGLRDASTPVS